MQQIQNNISTKLFTSCTGSTGLIRHTSTRSLPGTTTNQALASEDDDEEEENSGIPEELTTNKDGDGVDSVYESVFLYNLLYICY